MLDLSDLMTDPDFASRMILERTEIARREFGRPVYETKQIEITGVIQPASAEDLQPLADGANGYVTEGLVLYTDFVVTGGTNGIRADRIVFEGRLLRRHAGRGLDAQRRLLPGDFDEVSR